MASLYGMTGLPRNFTNDGQTVNPYFINQLSPYVNSIISEVYKDIHKFLCDNKESLEKLVSLLIEKRTLTGEEIDKLLRDTIKCN